MAEFVKQFETVSQHASHLPAYLCADERITIGEVNDLANQLAHWLSATLRAELSVVGVCTEVSLLTGSLVLGILKSGKVYMGLDPTYPCDRLRYMVEESNCALVVTDGTIPPDQFGTPKVVSIYDAISSARIYSTSNLAAIEEEDYPAYVTFTSGSTGRAKAVLSPMRQIDNRFSWMWEPILSTQARFVASECHSALWMPCGSSLGRFAKESRWRSFPARIVRSGRL